MLFFVRYFLCFPSHITRNILFFVYSDYHKISFIYPYLEEQGLHSSCIIDVHPNPSFETNEKDYVHILICLEPDHSCHLIDRKANQLPSTIFVEVFHKLVEPYFQPTEVHSRIRREFSKPLRLPYFLHPYPPNFIEYLHQFTGEDHITTEKHLGDFQNVIDNFEIVDEEVAMRLFCKSLFVDDALWFINMEDCSICSLTD
jgi:hypothetical protein